MALAGAGTDCSGTERFGCWVALACLGGLLDDVGGSLGNARERSSAGCLGAIQASLAQDRIGQFYLADAGRIYDVLGFALAGVGLRCGCLAGGQIRYQAMAGLDHRLALALAVAGADHINSPGYHVLGWIRPGHNWRRNPLEPVAIVLRGLFRVWRFMLRAERL